MTINYLFDKCLTRSSFFVLFSGSSFYNGGSSLYRTTSDAASSSPNSALEAAGVSLALASLVPPPLPLLPSAALLPYSHSPLHLPAAPSLSSHHDLRRAHNPLLDLPSVNRSHWSFPKTKPSSFTVEEILKDRKSPGKSTNKFPVIVSSLYGADIPKKESKLDLISSRCSEESSTSSNKQSSSSPVSANNADSSSIPSCSNVNNLSPENESKQTSTSKRETDPIVSNYFSIKPKQELRIPTPNSENNDFRDNIISSGPSSPLLVDDVSSKNNIELDASQDNHSSNFSPSDIKLLSNPFSGSNLFSSKSIFEIKTSPSPSETSQNKEKEISPLKSFSPFIKESLGISHVNSSLSHMGILANSPLAFISNESMNLSKLNNLIESESNFSKRHHEDLPFFQTKTGNLKESQTDSSNKRAIPSPTKSILASHDSSESLPSFKSSLADEQNKLSTILSNARVKRVSDTKVRIIGQSSNN